VPIIIDQAIRRSNKKNLEERRNIAVQATKATTQTGNNLISSLDKSGGNDSETNPTE